MKTAVLTIVILGGLAGPALAQITGPNWVEEPTTRVQMPPQHVVAGRTKARVVLLSMEEKFPDESLPAVETQTLAELAQLGLEVKRLPSRAARTDERLAELGAQAAANKALAAVRLVRDQNNPRVQVWLYDSYTGKMVLRQVPLPRQKKAWALNTVSLKVVELLNASLLEVQLSEPGERRAPPPPFVRNMVKKALEPPAPARVPPWGWSLGIGLMGGDSDLHPGAQLSVGAAWWPRRWLSVGGRLTVPLSSLHVSQPQGEATLAPGLLLAEVWFQPWTGGPLHLAGGVAGGAMVLRAAGEPYDGGRGHVHWELLGVFCGQGRVGLPLAKGVVLQTTFSAGWTLPGIEVRFFDEPTAQLGKPFWSGALQVQWRR